ncbi:MAG TPA: lysozyme inhibitor LprI family protein [Rhizomicrobium sp.]|jgi:uncharacterized protein YecT (DUF1311 family)|nr:lysozyme inhibitor LprI family protein [Rhizomicrobium sp.]
MKVFALALAVLLATPALAQTGAPAELAAGKALEAKGDSAGARTWYRKAAEHGSAEAWYRIGMTTPGGAPQAIIRAAEMGYAPGFNDALDAALFRAGPAADVDAAKRIADLARKTKADLGFFGASELETVDACYAAGTPPLVAQRAASTARYPDDNVGLAERYANGTGAKRDPRLALALVCHGAEVPAELNEMVAALTATEGQARLQKPFRFCDYAESGSNSAMCAQIASDAADRKRKTALEHLMQDWTVPQRAAFIVLKKAADAYFEEHAGSEVDNSGTLGGAFYLEAVGRQHDGLLKDLRAFEAAHPPPQDGFAAADKTLNALYRTVLARKDWSGMGTVDAGGIRKTQRLWLAYRDGWVIFAAARYPHIPAERWKAWATRRRIAELKDLATAN